MTGPPVYPLTSLSPQHLLVLKEATDLRLRNIIGANITSRYASSSSELAEFRLAIADKDVTEDSSVLADFRRLVPLTDYEPYRPWMSKLIERPCRFSEVENLLASGLPSFIGVSSSTSGSKPKHFARYKAGSKGCGRSVDDRIGSGQMTGTTAFIFTLSYRDVLDVTTDAGEVVQKIPICIASSSLIRNTEGWSIETDNTRIASKAPGHAAPWAAGFITHHKSFLMIHALFTLADRKVERIGMTFVTIFIDMLFCIQEEWDALVSSIRDGVIPAIEHIDHVRGYLQLHMRADPQRAEELRSIGPPFSCPAWAPRVWPNLNTVRFICSGTFATSLPMARSVIGPKAIITSPGYGCTECTLATLLNPEDPATFVIDTNDAVEYLDVADSQAHGNILQGWDLQSGKLYQPVVTTRDGLWRYLIDDVFHVIGFDPRNGSPVFKYHGRLSLAIRFPYAAITEADLQKVTRAITKENMHVQEFTTVVDRRELPETVGFIFEITGDIGLGANLARQKAFEALVMTNDEHQSAFNTGRLRLPTIRIVKHGTFADYRRWQGEKLNVGVGQIKVPVVMTNPNSYEWLAERVVREL
ncbi:GH3 auxin-responsive promoter [Scleroderma yunnanense]